MWKSMRFLTPACVCVLFASCDSDVLAPNRRLTSQPLAARPGGATFSTWSVSASQINMSWPDNSNNELGWEVHRSTTGASGNFSLLASLPANTTDYSNTGLAPLTEYCYKVRSFRKAGPNTSYGAFTNVSCNTTYGPPNAPSATSASPLTSSVVEVLWTANFAFDRAFRIERSATPSGPWAVAGTASFTRFTDNGRTAEQLVCYRVIATNPYGESAPSNVGCTTPAARPSDVTATSADASSIDVTWTDASSVEDGYSIERSLDGVNFGVIADLPANATTHHDASVTPDTRYWYRVRAKAGQGFSSYSDQAYAAAASRPPEAPTLYRAFPAGSRAAYVDFFSSSVTATGFRIERSTDGQSTWSSAATVDVSGMFVDEGRTPEAQVCYRVFALNAAGESTPSSVDCTTPPAHPTDITATDLGYGDGSVLVTWTDNSNVEEFFEVWYINCWQYWECVYDVYYAEANSTSVVMGPGNYFDAVYAYSDGGYSDLGTWAGAEGALSISSSSPRVRPKKGDPAPRPPLAAAAKRPLGKPISIRKSP